MERSARRNGTRPTRRAANAVRGTEAVVSAPGARVPVLVIPTNEELMIALETRDAVDAARGARGREGPARSGQAGGAPTAA